MVRVNYIGDKIIESKEGFIWCTNGELVRPKDFKDSGKIAYGYLLNNDTAVRLTKSKKKFTWSDGSPNTNYCGSFSKTDGFHNSEELRKKLSKIKYSSLPAVYEACSQVNAFTISYMPSVTELTNLYKSIMHGSMKKDLIKAGIYELCDYRENNDSINGWNEVWSSTESEDSPGAALAVTYLGNCYYYNKYSDRHRSLLSYNIIPFFRV